MKKCSTGDWFLFTLSWLTLAWTLTVAAPALGGTPPKVGDPLVSQLRQQIRTRNSAEFKGLLTRWEKNHGVRAVTPLLQIASDRRMPDPDRYIALMGSAKIGGKAVAPRLFPFLNDSSWMIRNGALRALSMLKAPQAGPQILKLLHDPALVVRLEAVAAIEALRPPEATTALLGAISDKANYHGDKAQWVPIRALDALSKIGDKSVPRKLASLLDRHQDPELLQKTVQTLEQLTGKKLEKSRPLRAQAAAWKRELR